MTYTLTARAQRRGRTALRLLAVCGVAGLLAGCFKTESDPPRVPYANDYRERHPITLREDNKRVEVFLGQNRGGLNPVQRADVLSFAQLWRREATSGIVLDVPRGGKTDHAANELLREIYSILAASGVPRNAVFVRDYKPTATALVSIKINYTKLGATAGPCGLWPENLGPGQDGAYADNHPFYNLGCAAQHNLAVMVDNPADLVQPRGEGPAYTARRTVAMDKYRKGENPSGAYPKDDLHGYDSGKLSDQGK